jgi:tetratricopeptide (TPR) repeat protein
MENSTSPNGWKLIKEGKYEEAYIFLTDALLKKPEREEILLGSRAQCLLLLNRPGDALMDYKRLIEINPDSDHGYIGAGIALLLIDNYLEAINLFQKSFHSKYSDPAGGILAPALLSYAANKINDIPFERMALKRLSHLWSLRVHKMWPGPIGGYILHEIDEHELLELSTKNQKLEARRLTQSYFWIAMRYTIESSDKSLILKYYRLSSKGHILELERFLAIKEISLMEKNRPAVKYRAR